MYKKLIIISVVLFLSVMAVLIDQAQQPEIITETTTVTNFEAVLLPQIELPSLTKNDRTEVTSINTPIKLIHFWASWCTVCMAEMPDLLNLVELMDGRLSLITISIDNNEQQALKALDIFKRQSWEQFNNPNVYWLHDDKKEASLQKLNVVKTPETFVVNTNNLIVDKVVGAYKWDSHKSVQKLNKLQ